MTDTRPVLYLSRLLPDPVMAIVRERFQLVQEPLDALPHPSALRQGLCQADAAIVTLGDCIDAETIHAAARFSSQPEVHLRHFHRGLLQSIRACGGKGRRREALAQL